MDAVRYVLAIMVIWAHFNDVFSIEPYYPLKINRAVGGFFALSGFLVFNSYLKSPSFWYYLKRRAARIIPSYSFIVLLCAFGLVALSSLSPAEYFSSPQLYRYLAANLTFLNFLGPTLPGVFTHNVMPAVNGSLWTIKVEWCLYLSVPLIIWLLRRIKCRPMTLFATIYVLSCGYRLLFAYLYARTGSEMYNILGRQFVGQLMYFIWGVILSFNIDKLLKHKWWVLAVCAVLELTCTDLPGFEIIFDPILVVTEVLWLSLIGSWGKWLASPDNLSYDMYLYHMPVLQVLWTVWLHDSALPLPLQFGICLTATVILAAISWLMIGRRFLRRPI